MPLITFDATLQRPSGELEDASVEARVSRWTDRGDYGAQHMASVEALRAFAPDGREITSELADSDFDWLCERALGEAA